METGKQNPLFKHFRQPAIYLKLPSNGRFYPEGSLDLGVTGDVPVYPMTVKDELALKTPDALMNGEGMASVVRSCCPSIKDPWSIPATDIDAIFIAIRLASYGQGMDINSKCPHCGEENEHTINLTTVLENIKSADSYGFSIEIDKMKFNFKPQAYKDINKLNIASFEERKLITNLVDSDLPEEEKKRIFNESFKKITDLNVSMLIASIESIEVDGTVVNDPQLLREYLDNCGRQTYNTIKDNINKLAEASRLPPVNLACNECTKEYESKLEFDQANFFV